MSKITNFPPKVDKELETQTIDDLIDWLEDVRDRVGSNIEFYLAESLYDVNGFFRITSIDLMESDDLEDILIGVIE